MSLVYAVTGASGFCGGAAARHLAAQGMRVVTLGRTDPGIGVHRHWDAAAHPPDLAGVDVVLHYAAAVGDPGPGRSAEQFERVNVDGARRLLDAAGERRVVWISSASVYDPRRDRSLVTEDHPTGGGHLNAYGRTKAAGDRIARSAGAVVLRPHAVYGPGDQHLLPRLRRAVRGGHVLVPGPDVRLSVTHVDTLTSAALAARGWQPGAYNVADPTPLSRDLLLIRALSADLGRRIRVRHLPLRLAGTLAAAATRLAAAAGREALLTPYAVDQLGHDFVLDLARARAMGWTPRDRFEEYVGG